MLDASVLIGVPAVRTLSLRPHSSWATASGLQPGPALPRLHASLSRFPAVVFFLTADVVTIVTFSLSFSCLPVFLYFSFLPPAASSHSLLSFLPFFPYFSSVLSETELEWRWGVCWFGYWVSRSPVLHRDHADEQVMWCCVVDLEWRVTAEAASSTRRRARRALALGRRLEPVTFVLWSEGGVRETNISNWFMIHNNTLVPQYFKELFRIN